MLIVTALRAVVVERYFHAEVEIAVRPNGELIIVQAEGRFEMRKVGLSPVSDAKIVDNECEHNVSRCMAEQAGGVGTLGVTMAGQMFDQANLRQTTGLRQSIHALADFEKNETAVFEAVELVASHDFVWDHLDGDSNVFVS